MLIAPRIALPALAALGLLSIATALAVGSIPLDWDAMRSLFSAQQSSPEHAIVWQIRLPRAAAAFAVGAMLALAGALMQVLLRNPLADPYILGVSGGAAVGALSAITLGLGTWWVQGGAFGGALGSMLLVFVIAHGRGSWTPTRLLLTGVVVAFGWGAVIALILALAPDVALRNMLFWLMGDLSHARLPTFGWVVLATGLLLALPWARSLNILAHGDLRAGALGVAVQPLRIMIYLLASLLTASAVTIAGSVGFIGLVVPHILRLALGADHRILLPAAALLGGTLLVVADTLARTVLAPQQLPVGALTALLGVPLFLLLMRRAP